MEAGLARAQAELNRALGAQMKLGPDATESERQAARQAVENARQGIISAATALKNSLDARMYSGTGRGDNMPGSRFPLNTNTPPGFHDVARVRGDTELIDVCPECYREEHNWRVMTKREADKLGVEKDKSVNQYRVKYCFHCGKDYVEMTQDEAQRRRMNRVLNPDGDR